MPRCTLPIYDIFVLLLFLRSSRFLLLFSFYCTAIVLDTSTPPRGKQPLRRGAPRFSGEGRKTWPKKQQQNHHRQIESRSCNKSQRGGRLLKLHRAAWGQCTGWFEVLTVGTPLVWQFGRTDIVLISISLDILLILFQQVWVFQFWLRDSISLICLKIW